MPKKFSEDQKKIIVNSFLNGLPINELAKNFGCTNITITRHLKKILNEKEFKALLKNNKTRLKKDNKENFKNEVPLKENYLTEKKEEINQNSAEEFIEIAPMNFQIDNEPQKDLSSIPISEMDFPKTVFMIVNSKIELETKLLSNYPDWQFLSENELNRTTIQIFFDMKLAKRFCNKEQKVIKVPNTNVFKIAAPILLSRGISRIVCPDQLISL